jgi:hypothetical protein
MVGCLFGVFAPVVALLLSIGGSSPSPVPASDTLPLELSWIAPDACPTLARARAEIRRRVGDIDKPLIQEPIAAQVEIHLTSSGAYQLSLHTKIGSTIGERMLAGPDCRELAEAAALVLALLINPKAVADAEPETKTEAPASPLARATGFAADTSASPAENLRFAIGLDAMLATRVLPGLAEGLAARVYLHHGRFAVVARADGFFAKDAQAASPPGASVSFYVLESAVQLCGSAGHRLGATFCLGGAVLRLHGESRGVTVTGSRSAYWPEALAELSGHVNVTPRARLRLSVEGRGLGSRPDFAILGVGSVYHPAAASLRGALGVDVLF